jgi:hypothetical protein
LGHKLNFSKHSLKRIEERGIKFEWIEECIQKPDDFQKIANAEIQFLKTIEKNESRCLKIVFNPIKDLVITAFFDRGLRKRGCKFEISV